jgi:hypothetical protein
MPPNLLFFVLVRSQSYNFKEMVTLDGDGEDGLQTKDGHKASRDIVQFVPFRDFQGDSAALASATLAELPTQVVEHLQRKGVQPKDRPGAEGFEKVVKGVAGMKLAA